MSVKPTSSSSRTSFIACSTMASGVGPPCFAIMSFSSEPALAPTRMGTPRAAASRPIKATLSCFLMLPGLIRIPWHPASSAASAYFHWKWMSAMTGIVDLRAITGSASTSSVSGTATRTMSQPLAARAPICCNVALKSEVFVVHIDWTLIGASPPTGTVPTLICLVFLRSVAPSSVAARGCGRAARLSGDRRERPDDIEVQQQQEQASENADDRHGDRNQAPHIDVAAPDLLVRENREMAAVERRQRKQVRHADEDVEVGDQQEERSDIAVTEQPACLARETDDRRRIFDASRLPPRSEERRVGEECRAWWARWEAMIEEKR